MSNTAIVQSVSDVPRAKQLLPEVSPIQAIETLGRFKVEACSDYNSKLVMSQYHPFVATVHAAFSDHRPLILSPDMFWLLIAHGLARHVNANSERMRCQFVQYDRKEQLIVHRDEFVKGSLESPWNEVFEEFSTQIKKHIGEENHSNIVASFSTTGAVEKAANEIVLMGTSKSYFEYEVRTLCGIPEVRLEGTVEDWNELPKRAEAIGSRYGMAWWTNRICPTLERIAQNSDGADDPELWKNIYKIENMSGGPYISGWLVDFFPYLQTTGFVRKIDNKLVDDWQEIFANRDDFHEKKLEKLNWLFFGERDRGITTDSLPGSLCIAPFKWAYLGHQYEMQFVAGFIGFTQCAEDFAVRPKIGWAVCET